MVMMSLLDMVKNATEAERTNQYIFFWKVADPYGELSQWYISPFILNGKSFSNAEQFMMHSKAEIFGDYEMASTILSGSSNHPAWHKRMGRMVKNFNQTIWNQMSMDVVIIGNLCKFTQNEVLMNILMDTGTSMMVEASPLDNIWGIGFGQSDAILNKNAWGLNKLGKALMMVRDIIVCRKMDNTLHPFTDTSDLMMMCKNVNMNECNIANMFEN